MKISGYTTTRNSIELNYPFRECILSMLELCDEVIVADSSDHGDGTLEALEDMMNEHDSLSVVHVDVDYSVPNHGIWDGKMKSVARSQCTGDYLWQMDCDEVTPEGQRPKLDHLISLTFARDTNIPLIALPVVEYWGSEGKVRVDVNPWKWRLSINDPNIIHGIPVHLRRKINGLEYAAQGTDGCDYIFKDSGQVVPCGQFMKQEDEMLRRTSMDPEEEIARVTYQDWFNRCASELVTVYHFSWWSVEQKINKFKHTWNKQWLSLYGEKKDDPDWNPFFDQSLDTVTTDQINMYARIIERETAGHIFHSKWNFTRTGHVKIDQPIPKVIKAWADANKTNP